MSKKKPGQIKARKRMVKNLLVMLLFLCVGFYGLAMAWHYHSVVKCIQAGTAQTNSGSYVLAEVHPPRNTVYTFVLDNGAKLAVPSEYVENPDTLALHTQLRFSYSKSRFGIPLAHTPTQITSLDGSAVFVREEEMLHAARGYQDFGVLFAAVGLPFGTLWPILTVHPSVWAQKFKQLRRKDKK